jgi:predicted RNA-binding Zn-ribbon protein involved in translation (DUF1610 family)
MQSAKYTCDDCGCEFEEPRTVMNDRADLSYGEVYVCPECGSENFEENED